MVDNAHNDEAAPQRSLSTTEASLCYREAGEKKEGSSLGTMGKGKERREASSI